MASSLHCGWAVGIGTAKDGEDVADVVTLACNHEIIGLSIDAAEQMAKQLLLVVDYLRAKDQEDSHA